MGSILPGVSGGRYLFYVFLLASGSFQLILAHTLACGCLHPHPCLVVTRTSLRVPVCVCPLLTKTPVTRVRADPDPIGPHLR